MHRKGQGEHREGSFCDLSCVISGVTHQWPPSGRVSDARTNIMNKPLGVALLAGGMALTLYGINASESFSSDASRFFTGNFTDKSIWLLVAGIVAGVLGLLTLRRSVNP
jgi:hypothetical protein